MRASTEKQNIIRELIGKGSSACVYKVVNLENNEIYALKQSLTKEVEFLFKNEINIFKKFKNECPYIVHFYNYLLLPSQINLELEYCQYGSLRDLLKKAKKRKIHLTEYEISSIIYMVLKGLNFMHKNNLINRDIKCKNILVNKDGIAKLCDFGISQVYVKDMYSRHKAGSPYWMAPELIKQLKYDKSVDIWSLGITCIELAEYEPPFINYDKNQALIRIKTCPRGSLSDPKLWSKEFNDFVSKCLKVNRFERPTCEELLKHDFITVIDKKKLNRKLIILQLLSKVGFKVLYNKKNIMFKNHQTANALFSKTFYNTKNQFRTKNPLANYSMNKKETNKEFRRKNNELCLDYSLKNSLNFNNNSINNNNEISIPDYESKSKINKYLYRKIGKHSPESNVKKFIVQSGILQKKIRNTNIININLNPENSNILNDSEQYDIYSSPINKSINQNKTVKTRNKYQNHTLNNSHLEESIHMQDRESNDAFYNRNMDKRLFLGRLRYPKNKSNLSFNNSLNNSEVNYVNYKRTLNPNENEDNIIDNNLLRYSCYNPNISNVRIKQIPTTYSKTINLGDNYINVKKIININNNISRNIINLRQNGYEMNKGQTNKIRSKGDITLSTTSSNKK